MSIDPCMILLSHPVCHYLARVSVYHGHLASYKINGKNVYGIVSNIVVQWFASMRTAKHRNSIFVF